MNIFSKMAWFFPHNRDLQSKMNNILSQPMKKLSLMLSMLALSTAMMATPAKPGVWKTIQLSDGTEVRVQLCGDENIRFWQSADGECYTKMQDSQLYQKADMALLRQNALQLREQQGALRAPQHRVSIGGSHPDFVGAKKGLIVLAQFTDVKFQDGHDADYYSHLANDLDFSSEDGHVGSIHDYFLSQSEGQFDLTFDVVGPVQLKHNQAYYGGNNSGGGDKNVSTMVVECVEAAEEELGDFSDYDWFDDGDVDQIFIIYAGRGEADGGSEDCIWPHRSQIWASRQYGGKTVSVYACSNEMQSDTLVDGIGAFCHEFSHCLGLPDLYDTSYSGNYGMGTWDLMNSGCYLGSSFRPCAYSGYERNYCGWKEPIYLTDDTHVSGMQGISEGGDYYIIQNDNYKNEYYILENRTKTGWDADLYGSGLLVTYIDFNQSLWSSNRVNTVDNYYNDHQRYTIFPADNSTTESLAGVAGDAYPYRLNNLLTDYSVPAATLYHRNSAGDKYMSKPVTNITKADDGSISFDFANEVGKEKDPLPTGVYFLETFDYCNGAGGNDDVWTIVTSNLSGLMTDNMGWEVSAGSGADGCAIFGTTSKAGSATTPEFTIESESKLTFRAAAASDGGLTLNVTVASGSASLSETTFTLARKAWTSYEATVSSTSYPTTLQLNFANDRRRFYLDDVKVASTSASGISSITNDSNDSLNEAIYTIDGRYLGTDAARLQPGMYIRDGKKFAK